MSELLSALAALIGREFHYQGRHCEVIEVLSEGPALVLACGGGGIQADQFGEPRRRAPNTFTIPVLSEVEADLHPVVRAIADAAEGAALRGLTGLD
jgi:hypothetical protein